MINGAILIGDSEIWADERFGGTDTNCGTPMRSGFSEANSAHVAEACASANAAAIDFALLSPDRRASFLERVAEEILAIGDGLIARAMQESGLSRARLEGERGRTIGQLEMFARVLREGSWSTRVIDPAMPDRQPPRPDLRLRRIALGPVAVFGASNFPLAFSVAGGDTASALAAGCPVIVKGHPAHPGTGELVARAIRRAVVACELSDGVFSYLPGTTNALGAALVSDPRVQAVGFTGSRAGGLALIRIAAERPAPIPVYAEMSAINPVFLLPMALKHRGAELASGFVQSLTMGAGQFCTNPGLLIAVAGKGLEVFLAHAAQLLADSAAQQMLTPAVHAAFAQGVADLAASGAVSEVARGSAGTAGQGQGALFRTTASAFLADEKLQREVFGASSLVVTVESVDELPALASALEGQLTATLHLDAEDEAIASRLLPQLERKAGRILVNGWPTGVEVGHAMVHGGPFPATSDSRSTSVGAAAIDRFLRPVCYQDLPASLLPAAVAPGNPWRLPERVDGVLSS